MTGARYTGQHTGLAIGGAALAGLIFGAGLLLSDMANPARVLAFLDLAGAWDPTLAFVMGGALLVTAPGYALLRRRGSTLGGQALSWPTRTDIDRPLVLGAALFGLGWGLIGLCPGPALVGLGGAVISQSWNWLIFAGGMIAGSLAYRFVR